MLEYNKFDWLQVLEMHEECLEVWKKTFWNWVPNGLRTRKHCIKPLNDLSSVVWGYNMVKNNKLNRLQVLEMDEECLELWRKTCWSLVPNGIRTHKQCFEAVNGLYKVILDYNML